MTVKAGCRRVAGRYALAGGAMPSIYGRLTRMSDLIRLECSDLQQKRAGGGFRHDSTGLMRVLFASLALLAGCTPNPRNEIPAIVAAAMGEAQKDAPGRRLCVERTIARWQSAAQAHRIDPPAPPGFEALYAAGVYRGGGALKGDRVATVAVRGASGCFALRGPLIAGDQAMLEVDLPGIGWNVWLKRTAPDRRVVMTTTSQYPG